MNLVWGCYYEIRSRIQIGTIDQIERMGKGDDRMNNLKTGEVISKRRKELGLTQNQLASSLNISFQAVSKWENGSAYPDIGMLPKLAAALNTTVDALLGYSSVTTDYDRRYSIEGIIGGLCQTGSVMIS